MNTSPPVLNQIELSPFFQRENITASKVVKKYNVAIEAYSPLGKGEHINSSEIHAVARVRGVSPGLLVNLCYTAWLPACLRPLHGRCVAC